MVLKKWIQKGIDWLSNLILAAAGLVVLWLFLLVFVYASFRIPTGRLRLGQQAPDRAKAVQPDRGTQREAGKHPTLAWIIRHTTQ